MGTGGDSQEDKGEDESFHGEVDVLMCCSDGFASNDGSDRDKGCFYFHAEVYKIGKKKYDRGRKNALAF